ncbi:MAG: NAD(P)/FAD-dependent oxidoreductase [Phaeodactylibacter sp.]|nr:NAD(P)/FAD-dependent oxidoreductase [Phaeodactylibacter sp.]MCB9049584.1 NAD(P)/FAD-dependent oxidoreductase [Lewinellaceae bacterium]
MAHHEVLIVGGGTAGITVAAMLRNKPNAPEVTIIEPSEKHYYQPIWTLVGAGVFPREISERNEADFIPPGVTWIKDYVESFQPEQNAVTLRGGEQHTYDYLIVAPGIQIDWNKIPGLEEGLAKAGSGVCSNYSYDTVNSTWDALKSIKKGKAIFTAPSTPIKCGGAPQKIMYLTADYVQKHGLKNKVEVVFASAGTVIFGVAKYKAALEKVVERYGIVTKFFQELVEIKVKEKIAIFEDRQTGEKTEMEYEMLHVTPPQSAPDFIKKSPLANEAGWVSVDKETMQHTKYPNIFSCGDASSLPTSKTGAAIRKQAPILVKNLMAAMHGQPLEEAYNGYTSCPLVTGYGSLILAEFDYDSQPAESFPFDQAQERYSMYALKAYGLPQMYWHGMLRGREF